MPVEDAAGAPNVKPEDAAGAAAPKGVDVLLAADAVEAAPAGLNVKPLGALSVPDAGVEAFADPPKSDEPFVVLAADVPLLVWLPNVNGVAAGAGALAASVVLVDGDSCMLFPAPAASLVAAAGAGVAGVAAPNRFFGDALGVPKPPKAGVAGATDAAGLSAAGAPNKEPPLAAAGFAPKLKAGVPEAGAAELAGAAPKPPKLNAALGASAAPLASAAASLAGGSALWLFASSSSSAERFLGAPNPPNAGVAAGAELEADAGAAKLNVGAALEDAGGFGASAVAALPKKFGTGPDFFSSRAGAAAGAAAGMLKKLEAPAAGVAFASSLFFAASVTAAGAKEKRGLGGSLLADDAGGAA